MGEIIAFLLPPFVATLAIVAIHVYLGIHVIEREVIFVDLALAQIAALGSIVAFVIEPGGPVTHTYTWSILFVIVGSAIFSVTRVRNQRIPQEAIIGIAYVIATAASIIVADQSAGGAEHIKETLMGAILWVNWGTIIPLVVLYVAVGGLHWLLRKRFMKLTDEYRSGEFEKGDRWLDFVFYLTFGLVIVFSVKVAGVLLVFSFLVVPTAISSLFSRSWLIRLLIGWGVGITVTLLGLMLSWWIDVPCGPSIVILLGIFLVLAAALRPLIMKPVEDQGSCD
jgi:zinc/manganese transport system permease protein